MEGYRIVQAFNNNTNCGYHCFAMTKHAELGKDARSFSRFLHRTDGDYWNTTIEMLRGMNTFILEF